MQFSTNERAQNINVRAQFSTNERVKNINSRPLRGDICNYVLKNTSRQLLFRRVQTRFGNFYPKRKRSRLLFNLCLITVASCLSLKLMDKAYSNIERKHRSNVISKICIFYIKPFEGWPNCRNCNKGFEKISSVHRSTNDRDERAIQY